LANLCHREYSKCPFVISLIQQTDSWPSLATRNSWLNAGQKRNVRLVYAGVMNRHTKVLILTYIRILYASSVNFGLHYKTAS